LILIYCELIGPYYLMPRKRAIPVQVTLETITGKQSCKYCLKEYSSKCNLDRHIRQDQCKGVKTLKDKEILNKVSDLQNEVVANKVASANEIDTLKTQVAELVIMVQKTANTQPVQNTNNLNVMCLGSKDNILDILVAKQGILKALTMVKQSALGRLTNACTLLEKAYLPEGERPAIMHPGKSKNTYVYYDENNKRVVERSSAIMAKKLADIVQRTYLKGMSCLKKDILGIEKTDQGQPYQKEMSKLRQVDLKAFELDPYDLESWMQSVHELRDERCQMKLLKEFKIPFEDDC
jgi:hypothetical protein